MKKCYSYSRHPGSVVCKGVLAVFLVSAFLGWPRFLPPTDFMHTLVSRTPISRSIAATIHFDGETYDGPHPWGP